MRNPKRSLAHLFLLFAVPLLGGCLEFETQTIEFAYDAQADRATLHLVYHGLMWGKDDPGTKGAKALSRAVDGGEFCVVEWPFHIQPKKLREKEKDPLAVWLGQHIKSESVGFFKNADGQLAGGQIVTLDKVTEFLKMVNQHISQWLIEANGTPKNMKWRRHTKAMMLKAAKAGHEWVRVDGNAISLHAFCSDLDYVLLKRRGLEELFDTEPKDRAEAIAWLSQFPGSWQRDGDAIIFTFGNTTGRTRFDVPREGRDEYVDNLAAHAEKTWGLELDTKVAEKLVTPDDTPLGRFAKSLRLSERARILMTVKTDEAAKRLHALLDELPDEPDLRDAGSMRGFWSAWLENRKRMRAAERKALEPEPPAADDDKR